MRLAQVAAQTSGAGEGNLTSPPARTGRKKKKPIPATPSFDGSDDDTDDSDDDEKEPVPVRR